MTDLLSAKLPGGGRIEAERAGSGKFLVRRYDAVDSLRSVSVESKLPDELGKADVSKRGTADPSFRHVRDAGEVLI